MSNADKPRARAVAELEKELFEKYPELRATLEAGVIHVTGSFPVVHDGKILERFQIDISLPADFPHSIPVLRETGGRIPRIADRHINPDGTACPMVPEEWLLLPNEQRTVMGFLEGPVHNYFIGQSLVERGLPWPSGERDHGRPGLIQSYGEMLGITDEAEILRYLRCLCHERIKGHWDCPCGSGKKLRHCHLEDLRALQLRIPMPAAQSALSRLEKSAPPRGLRPNR